MGRFQLVILNNILMLTVVKYDIIIMYGGSMDINKLKEILKAAEEAKKVLSSMKYKCCSVCEDILPFSSFNTARSASDGLYSYCKQCAKKQRQEYVNRTNRSKPRKAYSNIIRPSIYVDCIEVKIYGDYDLWMILDVDVFKKYSDVKFYISKSEPDLYYCCVRLETKSQKLHRLICPTREGFEVDHINRNPLDNRRENLREVTRKENLLNRRPLYL